MVATYVHLGRMSAMILAPSMPRLFEARLRLVMALVSGGISDRDVSLISGQGYMI
jgi:hypothetical protein